MPKQTWNLSFPRHESLTVTSLGTMEVVTPEDKFESSEEVLEAIKRGLTQWVRCTKTGKSAWVQSCEDLNIGDLSSCPATSYMRFLRAEGVLSLKISLLDVEDDQFAYDTVLVNEEDLE